MGLVVGIFFFENFRLPTPILYFIAFIALSLFMASLFIRKSEIYFKFRWLFGFSLAISLFLIGYERSEQLQIRSNFEHADTLGMFTVELTEMPVEKEKSMLCRIQTMTYIDASHHEKANRGKALIYIAKDSLSKNLASGDRLLIRTKFTKPSGIMNPNGFDYAAYLKKQGIRATAYIATDSWKRIGANKEFSLFRLSEKYQHKLLEVYKRAGMQGDEFAVLAALTLGSKDALHPELRQNYSTSGGMHILAVSGLHVGVIYFILSFLLRFMDSSPRLRYLKAFLLLSSLWAYAFITGLPPSVIRATTMFSFVAIGQSLDRKSQIYNTIAASAFLMLLYNPNFIFDVGFQLSYSAVISIVYFQPKIKRWFAIENRLLRWAWELTAVSLAAQIGTAALSFFYFHQFPNYFLITNFVAIPFASLIIYVAVALFATSTVALLASPIAFILLWLLKILNYLIEAIHNFPFSLSIASISLPQVILIFCIVILLTTYIETKKIKFLFVALHAILLYVCIDIALLYNTLHTNQLVVFAANTHTQVNFVKGKQLYVVSTDSTQDAKTASNFWLSHKLNKPIYIQHTPLFKNNFIVFDSKRIMLLTTNKLRKMQADKPLEVDYLIIGNKVKSNMQDILRCVLPKQVIVDQSISSWYAANIEQSCAKNKIPCYNIAKHGAFRLEYSE